MLKIPLIYKLTDSAYSIKNSNIIDEMSQLHIDANMFSFSSHEINHAISPIRFFTIVLTIHTENGIFMKNQNYRLAYIFNKLSKYTQNPSLGIWVSNMRTEFKKWENGKQSSMTAERIAKLNNLGFDWVVVSEAWEIRLEELQEFHQNHGHCRVPYKYPQNPSLGMWVKNMRTEFKKQENGKQSSMTVEQIAKLNNLGFDWGIANSVS